MDPPNSWADLLTEGLPGDIGYPNMDISYAPNLFYMLNEIYGGDTENPEPMWEELNKFKDNLILFSGYEALDGLAQGDVSILPDLHIFQSYDPDSPEGFVLPKEGGLALPNVICVVKGTEHRDLVEKLIDFHISPEVQLNLAEGAGEAPTNTLVEVPEGSLLFEVDDLIIFDNEFISAVEQIEII